MRQVVLQFIVSLDGYSCDVGNGLRDVMMSIDDPEQEEYALSRLWPETRIARGDTVLPAAAGQGAPLFTGLARPLRLRLVESTAFPSGYSNWCTHLAPGAGRRAAPCPECSALRPCHQPRRPPRYRRGGLCELALWPTGPARLARWATGPIPHPRAGRPAGREWLS